MTERLTPMDNNTSATPGNGNGTKVTLQFLSKQIAEIRDAQKDMYAQVKEVWDRIDRDREGCYAKMSLVADRIAFHETRLAVIDQKAANLEPVLARVGALGNEQERAKGGVSTLLWGVTALIAIAAVIAAFIK